MLVAMPSYSTIFPAALATNSPEYLVLPEPLRPKQLHHLHTWPSQGQTQVLHLQSTPWSHIVFQSCLMEKALTLQESFMPFLEVRTSPVPCNLS